MSESELDRLRADIERIDRTLIGLIEKRVRAARRAARKRPWSGGRRRWRAKGACRRKRCVTSSGTSWG